MSYLGQHPNAERLEKVARPEVVHQLRVGLRRLRAAMKTFDPVVSDRSMERLDAELSWLAEELDAARDVDVFIQDTFLPIAERAKDPNFAPLGRYLLNRQSKAYDRALAAVRSHRYATLLFETAAWIEIGPWCKADHDGPLKAYAENALDRLRRRVRRRANGFVSLSSEDRHKLRIRAKQLRYAVEFFGSLYEDRAKDQGSFLKSLKRMQAQLGKLNDTAVARDRILRDLSGAPAEALSAAGKISRHLSLTDARVVRAAAANAEAFRSTQPFWRSAS